MSVPATQPNAASHIPNAVAIIDLKDKQRQAYAMRKSGRKANQIAKQFGVDKSTIYRWIEAHRDDFRQMLENTPPLNIIAQELADLETIEQEARDSAGNTKSERQKNSFLTTALKAKKVRHHLLLETGVIPKEPTKIYNVVNEMKPFDKREEKREERTKEELVEDVLKAIKYCRRL